MRHDILLFVLVLLFVGPVSALGGGDETPPLQFVVPWHGSAYTWEMKPLIPIVRPGPVTFVVKYKQVTPHNRSLIPCDTTKPFILIKHDRLSIEGPTTIPFTWRDTGQMSFSVTIPAGDTSGFELQGPCGINDSRYFVTTGDTVETHWSDPRLYPRPRTQWWEHPPQGQRKRGAFPILDSLWGDIGIAEEDTVTQPYAKAEIFHHDEDSLKSANVEKEQRNREELEQSPLIGQQTEYISVDGQLFMREEGETKFHPAVPVRRLHELKGEDSLAMARAIDSVSRASANVRQDVRLDLQTPERLETVRRIVDSLFPTDTAGIYRARLTRQMMQELWNAGIKIGPGDTGKKMKESDLRDQSSVTEQNEISLRSSTDVIFHEVL
jgi:hypothetical protein